jgi:STE24 endopeptidase
LYDTLIEQMDTEELEAVLAHEIGHYKCGHVPKRLALSAIFGLAGFWFVAFLTKAPWLFEDLRFNANALGRLGPVLLVLSVASGVFTFWFAPLSNFLSRKHEYEADAFARSAIGGPDYLVSALRKLHVENLSNPIPHHLYASVYHSHPTLPEREGALRS